MYFKYIENLKITENQSSFTVITVKKKGKVYSFNHEIHTKSYALPGESS